MHSYHLTPITKVWAIGQKADFVKLVHSIAPRDPDSAWGMKGTSQGVLSEEKRVNVVCSHLVPLSLILSLIPATL